MEQPTRFADAMMGVGWLVESAKAVELLRFADHNGASAKRRTIAPHEKSKVDKGVHVLEEKNSQSVTFCLGHTLGGVSAWRATLSAVLWRGMPVAAIDR
ncbi:hypothetical protein [Pseudomonas laurylsulfatiphila]|uniref:hypothetical protein n=1 Tax=Pseudomonas laurylsulfatiphila TaxID=2011015 RepID=UPI00215E9153|nr:hypothetical protein [Pseudomonas laurylsulfatiphila]UVM07113.1 hypothetical protein LOY25_10595 [Pseudomonas laurylsulfatiphila]